MSRPNLTIPIFRKYRIRAALYFQYKDQSGDNYSDKEMQSFLNTKAKLVFTQENPKSNIFGKKTVKYKTTSSHNDANWHLAESTVERLINQRCKGQQHTRWTRVSLDPILQLRSAISSNEWPKIWKTVAINSVVIH